MIAAILLLATQVCVPNWIPSEGSPISVGSLEAKCTLMDKAPTIPPHKKWDKCGLMTSDIQPPFYECYWDSIRWYPNDFEVIRDFMRRDGSISEEHTINHWAVSFKYISGWEGDCGSSSIEVLYRNVEHVNDMPDKKFEMVTWMGECGRKNGLAGVELYEKENP